MGKKLCSVYVEWGMGHSVYEGDRVHRKEARCSTKSCGEGRQSQGFVFLGPLYACLQVLQLGATLAYVMRPLRGL